MSENSEIGDFFCLLFIEEMVQCDCSGNIVIEIIEENQNPISTKNIKDNQKINSNSPRKLRERRSDLIVSDFTS